MVTIQGDLDFVVVNIGTLIAGNDSHAAFNASQNDCLFRAGVGIGAGNGRFCHRLLTDSDGQGLGVACIVVRTSHGVGNRVGPSVHQIVSSLAADHTAEVGSCGR